MHESNDLQVKKKILDIARWVGNTSAARTPPGQATSAPPAESLIQEVRRLRERVNHLGMEVVQLDGKVEELQGRGATPVTSVTSNDTLKLDVRHTGSLQPSTTTPKHVQAVFPLGETIDVGLDIFPSERPQPDALRDQVQLGSTQRALRQTVDWSVLCVTQLRDDSSFLRWPFDASGKLSDILRIPDPRQRDRWPLAPRSSHRVPPGQVAMGLVLCVMGSLLIAMFQVGAGWPGEDPVAQGQPIEGIAAAQSVSMGSQKFSRPLTVRERRPSFQEQQPDDEIPFKSVEMRIDDLVSRPRADVEEEPRRQEHVSRAEREAQARAAQLAASMKPKVAEAFSLIRAAIAKAALEGLVRVESVSDPLLPEPLMMSAYQLRGRPRSLKSSGLVISFNKNEQWNVYVELGYVSSPPDLAAWSEGTDLSYPTLRVSENGRVLATIYFDSITTELTVNTSDVTSRFSEALDVSTREFQREEPVANAILSLLQGAQVRRSTL